MMSEEEYKPTVLGRVIVFYPALLMLLLLLNSFINIGHYWWQLKIGIFLFIFYIFPLICFRIHNLFFPLKKSLVRMPSGKYPAWWGAYHIQRFYLTFPILEAALRMVPGLYSFWLRLWGSKIGKNIYWPPLMEIADKSLMDIGDSAILGHCCSYYSHVLSPAKDGRIIIYVNKITIGEGAFIGTKSNLGPGVVVAPMTKIDVGTNLFVNEKV